MPPLARRRLAPPGESDLLLSFAALRLKCARHTLRRNAMAWTTPTLVEICIGLEINGYLPAEF